MKTPCEVLQCSSMKDHPQGAVDSRAHRGLRRMQGPRFQSWTGNPVH